MLLIRITLKYLLLLALSTQLFSQTIHSSVSTYFESTNFTNSTQKNDSIVYGVGGDIHYNDSAYKFTYEHADTNTIQPPLPEDLAVDKLFLKYGYEINDKLELQINYINILNDNLAITDGGVVYGVGITYSPTKREIFNFTQFYTAMMTLLFYRVSLK